MNIGERVKAERKALGLSQKDLACGAKVSQQTISKLETGNAVSSRELVSISRVLNVTTEWLESGQGTKDRFSFLASEIAKLNPADQAELAAQIHARLAAR